MNLIEMLDAVKWLPTGDYCECGVFQGASAKIIAEHMNRNSVLWLLDSFEGHGKPGPYDNAKAHPKGRYAETGKEAIAKLIPKAIIIPGFIPDSLKPLSQRFFRFVHIDLDHYAPTLAACLFFKSRMISEGMIRFDDYTMGDAPGAKKAIDEVFGNEVLLGDARWVAPNLTTASVRA